MTTAEFSGWHGSLARIDLTQQTFRVEPIPAGDLELCLGGRGLGAAYLLRETPAHTDPLGPHNPLIFSTGPLAGTGLYGSDRYVLHTKSPQTGLYLFSVSGGHFGSAMKRTGFDVILIQGRSERPVYLWIDGDQVHFRDASHLWGMDTEKTQAFIQSEVKKSATGITCIGPAGENQVPYACIINERRALGRGGAGAVMGSKNLKALVVGGNCKTPVADIPGLRDWTRRGAKELKANPMTSQVLKTYGSSIMVGNVIATGTLPENNWRSTALDEAQALKAEKMRTEFLVKDLSCSKGCPVKCVKAFMVREGPWAGALSEGPDYETVYAFGSCCGIYDLATVIQADALCDQWGLDTISTGVSIAFAMECLERGIIDAAEVGAADLRFGNDRAMIDLIKDIAYNRGFGAVVAQGTRHMAQRFGQDSARFAMHAKGMELGGYDPRGIKGMGLVYACGPRGGCHHSGGYTVLPEIMNPALDRFAEAGKAPLVAGTRNRRAAFCDSGLMCAFVAIGLSDDIAAGLLTATTGVAYAPDDLPTIGDRISCLERAFNVREGLRPADDVLPARLTEENITAGPSKDHGIDDLEAMKAEFYRVCGWDPQTGAPLAERLEALELEWVKAYLDA